MFLLLFTVYRTLRLHVCMIILVVWNVRRYISSRFEILSNSADFNLYILPDLPEGARVFSLHFMSVFLYHIMSFFSWPLEHLLTFLYEGHVVHKSTLIFGVRVNNFANILFVFVNGNDVVYNVICFGTDKSFIVSHDFCGVFSDGVIWLVISIGGCYFTHCPPWIHTSQ